MVFCDKFIEIAFKSVICDFMLKIFSVTLAAYVKRQEMKKPWGQKFDSARKHNCSFLISLSKMVD